jgi:hypothetical protein
MVATMIPEIDMLPASPAAYGIFDSINRLVLPPNVDERWPSLGLTFQPRPVRDAYRYDVNLCGTPETLSTDIPSCETYATQNAFRVWDILGWESRTQQTDIDMEGMLSTRFREILGSHLALELMDASGSNGMSLSSRATAPNDLAFGAAAVRITRAMAVIENELGERLRGRRGTIHMSPGMFAQAVQPYKLERMDSPSGVDVGPWVTPNGNIVVVDAGYITIPAPSGQAAATAAQEWVYGTSDVFYALTDPELIGDLSGSFTLNRNLIRRSIEAYGVLLFEPNIVTAALANYDV